MTIRSKLALAMAGTAAIALVVSGALFVLIVRTFNQQITYAQMDAQVVAINRQVPRSLRQPAVTLDYLNTLETDLGVRVLLLDAQGRPLVYQGQVTVPAGQRRSATQVVHGHVLIDGDQFLADYAPATAAVRQTFPGTVAVVVATPQSVVDARTKNQLTEPLALAALVSLLSAAVVGFLLSRALTARLTRLGRAAHQLAGGDYSARVEIGGGDEIAEVGHEFNRMAAEVEATRQAQRDFLANVSHELRTPLTSILGFSQALIDGSAQGPLAQGRAAQIIQGEAERLLRISRELVDLARVEAGALSLSLTPVDLGRLLDHLQARFAGKAADRHLEWRVDAGDPATPPVLADADRVNQVLDNLAENAIRYASAAHPVTWTLAPAAGGVELVQENSTDRLPPSAAQVFERFFRADPSRQALAGVGLGLSVARELVAAMGGRLGAELDGPPGGAGVIRFRLWLPGAEGRPTR
ncbi:MAG: sensor histidine kinase [Candidatus Dormibacteria bacterium]